MRDGLRLALPKEPDPQRHERQDRPGPERATVAPQETDVPALGRRRELRGRSARRVGWCPDADSRNADVRPRTPARVENRNLQVVDTPRSPVLGNRPDRPPLVLLHREPPSVPSVPRFDKRLCLDQAWSKEGHPGPAKPVKRLKESKVGSPLQVENDFPSLRLLAFCQPPFQTPDQK